MEWFKLRTQADTNDSLCCFVLPLSAKGGDFKLWNIPAVSSLLAGCLNWNKIRSDGREALMMMMSVLRMVCRTLGGGWFTASSGGFEELVAFSLQSSASYERGFWWQMLNSLTKGLKTIFFFVVVIWSLWKKQNKLSVSTYSPYNNQKSLGWSNIVTL